MWRRMLTTKRRLVGLKNKRDIEYMTGHTEEEDKGDAVEDEYVGNVSDSGVFEQLHLLLSGAHE
jgi:hypothetical protein